MRLQQRKAKATRRREGFLVRREELQQVPLLERGEPRGVLERPLRRPGRPPSRAEERLHSIVYSPSFDFVMGDGPKAFTPPY